MRRIALLVALMLLPFVAQAQQWRSPDDSPRWSFRCGGSNPACSGTIFQIPTTIDTPVEASALMVSVVSDTMNGTSISCVVNACADMPAPVVNPIAVPLGTFTEASDDTTVTTAVLTRSGVVATDFDAPAGTVTKRWMLPQRISFQVNCNTTPTQMELDAYYMYGK